MFKGETVRVGELSKGNFIRFGRFNATIQRIDYIRRDDSHRKVTIEIDDNDRTVVTYTLPTRFELTRLKWCKQRYTKTSTVIDSVYNEHKHTMLSSGIRPVPDHIGYGRPPKRRAKQQEYVPAPRRVYSDVECLKMVVLHQLGY